jgi:lysozyme family protein
MTPSFNRAYERTKNFEGGWSDHPSDRGGKTKYGLTEATWKKINKGKPPCPIADITQEQAKAVYWEHYWRIPGIDKLDQASIPQVILSELFDSSVLHGPNMAIEWLQESYNLLRRWDVPALRRDGICGVKTRAAIITHCLRGNDYAYSMLATMRYLRGTFMVSLTERDETQKVFLNGWMKRLV